MRSPIHWAVLGLLIERRGHAYDLFTRFDSAYAGAIELSSHSQINGALKALEQRRMIERLPPDEEGPDAQAQPRTRYQPSAKGLRDYEEYLLAWSPRSADAPGVFARQVGVLPPASALVAIERFEEACLSETSSIRLAREQGSPPSSALQLEARLMAEEKHLALAAKIQWARYARSQIKALASARMDGVPASPADGLLGIAPGAPAGAGEPAEGREGSWPPRRAGGEGFAGASGQGFAP
jgi:DNA-binding PadR family transcriptional regulator